MGQTIQRDGALQPGGAQEPRAELTAARHQDLSLIDRARIVLDRPRLWRATAGLSVLVFLTSLLIAAQGSLTILVNHRRMRSAAAPGDPSWARWCRHGQVRMDRVHLAPCAQVEGIVIDVTHGPSLDESHLAVIGDFHLVVVRLSTGGHVPGLGARVIAIGPMVRARDGQREIQAFRLRPA